MSKSPDHGCFSVTVHCNVPPCFRKKAAVLLIFHGTCPTMLPSFIKETAYLSMGLVFFFPLSIQCFSDYWIPHIFVNMKTSNTTYKNCNENSKSAKFRDRITLHCWKSEKYTSKPKVKQKKMKVVSLCFSYRFFPILIDMVNCYSRGELYISLNEIQVNSIIVKNFQTTFNYSSNLLFFLEVLMPNHGEII